MLASDQEIQGFDRSEIFSTMLEELRWRDIKAFLQSNTELLKLSTAGGHRLEPKRGRMRVQRILLKEAEKVDFSQEFCNGLFALWYPTQKDLYERLEGYFHSDEYKEFREEHDLEEDGYELSDEQFDDYFEVADLITWRVLLCFSPMSFSDDQLSRILDDNQGNVELLEKIEAHESTISELKKENSRLRSDRKRSSKIHKRRNSELRELKKESRTFSDKYDSLSRKADHSLEEGKKLRKTIAGQKKELRKLCSSLKEKDRKGDLRLRNEVKRLEKELSEWRRRYEEQRVENRELEEGMDEAREEAERARQQCELKDAEANQLSSFADLLMTKLDWPQVGRQLKLSPTLRRQFNSLIRTLNYEEGRSLSIEGALPKFWSHLMEQEKLLVQNIAQSNSREVKHEDVETFWLNLTDLFEDVRISLEARIILLKIFHEIFYQVIEMDDLEVPRIPRKRRRRSGRK